MQLLLEVAGISRLSHGMLPNNTSTQDKIILFELLAAQRSTRDAINHVRAKGGREDLQGGGGEVIWVLIEQKRQRDLERGG